MSDLILSQLYKLPSEIIQCILDYIPTQNQKSLVEFKVFRKFVLPKLLSNVHVLRGDNNFSISQQEIDDPFTVSCHYKPICEHNQDFHIESQPLYLDTSNCLIKLVEKYGIFPSNLRFHDQLAFFETCRSNPEILANSKEIYIRMRNVSLTSRGWWSVLNSICSVPFNITTLELISIPIDEIQFSSSLRELIFSGKIRDKVRVFESLTQLTKLSLRGVQIEQSELESLSDNIEYLNISDLKITHERLCLPKNLKELVVVSTVEYSEEYMNFSLKFPCLESFVRFEFTCDELTNLSKISMPICLQELILKKCYNLLLLDRLETYVNLRVFEWIGALFSPYFYLLSEIPPHLQTLVIDHDNSKNSVILNVLARSMPRYFYSGYGMYTFRIGKAFILPHSIKQLTIKNCQFLEINCEELMLSYNLRQLTFTNLAGFVNLNMLRIPPHVTLLDFSSMNIELIDYVTLPRGLRHLYLDDNKLRRTNNTNLASLTNLQTISLTGNLFKLSDQFSNDLPKNITHIKLNGLIILLELPCNNIKHLIIPSSIHLATDLQFNDNIEILQFKDYFSFNYSGFRLPKSLRVLIIDDVSRLEISKCQWLEHLPKNLQELRISVSKNGSCEISDVLQTIKFPFSLRLLELKNLNISKETFEKLNFKKCRKLTSIEIDQGTIREINLNKFPKSLVSLKLQNLKTSNFLGNFTRFKKLKSLFLSGNKLRKYVYCHDFKLPPSLEDLSLMQCNIKTIEISNIQECKEMRQVNLSKNSWMDPIIVANVAREFNKVSQEFSCILVDDVIMDDDLTLMKRNSRLAIITNDGGKDYSLIYSCPTGQTSPENESDSDVEMLD